MTSQAAPAVETKESGQQAPNIAAAAASAAETAANATSNAAIGVKDTMFSMFGGGNARKETTKDGAEDEDRSGSAKAAKDKAKEQESKGDGEDEEGVSDVSHETN